MDLVIDLVSIGFTRELGPLLAVESSNKTVPAGLFMNVSQQSRTSRELLADSSVYEILH
jgi:hypothetical protein